MLRAVIFDLDDTLFDDHHCMLQGLGALAQAHPELAGQEPASLLEDYLAGLAELEPDFHAGRLTLSEYRHLRFERLYERWGIEGSSGAHGLGVYRAAYLAARRAVDGAAALLAELRARGLKIGVLTNWTREEQQAKLEHCGLSDLVDALMTTEDGPPKPHPEAYLGMLRALDVSAAEAVMIGDSWANDVIGPRAVGMRGLWFERQGREVMEDGVDVVRSYTELDAVLALILQASQQNVAPLPNP